MKIWGPKKIIIWNKNINDNMKLNVLCISEEKNISNLETKNKQINN